MRSQIGQKRQFAFSQFQNFSPALVIGFVVMPEERRVVELGRIRHAHDLTLIGSG
jgi:hypothetical protein